MVSETQISSTSELIYHLVSECFPNYQLSREAAECLYVGIMTDTGSFSYACSYASTFQTCAGLVKSGINPEAIHRLVYDTYSEYRLRLLGHCLVRNMQIIPSCNSAYIHLSKKELDEYHHVVGDTEGIVNYPLSIEKIRLAALFTEKDGLIRVSLRSKGEVPVNLIAKNHYQGGGHTNAAGGNSYLPLQQTINQFESILNSYKKYLC